MNTYHLCSLLMISHFFQNLRQLSLQDKKVKIKFRSYFGMFNNLHSSLPMKKKKGGALRARWFSQHLKIIISVWSCYVLSVSHPMRQSCPKEPAVYKNEAFAQRNPLDQLSQISIQLSSQRTVLPLYFFGRNTIFFFEEEIWNLKNGWKSLMLSLHSLGRNGNLAQRRSFCRVLFMKNDFKQNGYFRDG